jgi:integrase
MNKPLTTITVDKLKPQATRYEVPDGGQRGLLLTVFPSGKKSFIVRYRFGGVQRKLTLGGLSLAAARKAAAAALYDVHEGRDPSLAKKETKARAAITKAETVQWCCEQFLKREGDKLRTAGERVRAFERLVYPAIGDMPLATLRRSHIVKLLDDIQDKHGDRRADLVLAYLRRAFNWQASRVDDFSSPIVKGMDRYNSKERERSRVLTDDEVRKIWLAIEPDEAANPYHALVRFLLLTGGRRNEARLLPWSEIVGSDWKLPAARNKTKVELIRPLSKAAQAVLHGLPRIGDGPLVFSHDGRRPMELAKPKARLDAVCGVSGWVLHDLRRTARTLMSRAGISVDIAERALGHAIGGVRGVYDQHKYHAEMQQAFEALAAQIERIINPPPANVTPMRRRRRAAS